MALKWSDYGLLKKCQNEKNAVFNGDLLLRRGPKPKHGSNMVRFGSADLWTSALGLTRVQRSDPPGPEAGRGPKRPNTAKIQKFGPDLRFEAIYILGDLLKGGVCIYLC